MRKTIMTKTNGALLARVDERVKVHSQQIDEVKNDVKDVKDIVNEIKTMFTSGEGKIKRNFMLIEDIRKDREKAEKKRMAMITIIVATVSIIVNIAFKI